MEILIFILLLIIGIGIYVIINLFRKLEKYEEAALLNKKTKELDVYKTEKKDIIKFIKRALEFGEYEGINVGRDKINDLYLRLRNDFSLYIP